MIRKEKALAPVRADGMSDQSVPHWVRFCLGAIVPSHRVDFSDCADPDHESRHLLPEWMPGLAVKQCEGFFLNQAFLEEQVYQRLLSCPAKYPCRREGRLLVGWQRI